MKRIDIAAFAVVALTSSAAFAQKPAATAPASSAGAAPAAGAPAMPPAPPKPGVETEALKPFAHSSNATGKVPAGAFGNPAELATKTKSTCKWVAGNFWVACDIDETIGAGKTARKWQGHWLFGYDLAAKGYRGVMATGSGEHEAFKGTLDGSKLVWESMTEQKANPQMPSKMRITEDAGDAKNIQFTEEGYLGGKWVTLATAVEKPTGGAK